MGTFKVLDTAAVLRRSNAVALEQKLHRLVKRPWDEVADAVARVERKLFKLRGGEVSRNDCGHDPIHNIPWVDRCECCGKEHVVVSYKRDYDDCNMYAMCSSCARKNDRLFIDEHNAQCDRQELDALDKELDAMGDW